MSDPHVRALVGDVRAVLPKLPERSVRCCVTSPPYWGLRDYGHPDQLGQEPTPEAYVAALVDVFRAVRRALTDDGTLWLNLGDSYSTDTKWGGSSGSLNGHQGGGARRERNLDSGLKPKDLIGIPWRVAFALQADGWYLRSDIIWAKPNPMPESVTDRPTKAHEYLFLLAKSARYHYNADAIAEPITASSVARLAQDVAHQKGSDRVPGKTNGRMKAVGKQDGAGGRRYEGFNARWDASEASTSPTRNARTVWTIPTQPYAGAHFATMPAELAQRCILAGSAPGDTVLDPFGGSGTTAAVAIGHGRSSIYVDCNPAYAALAAQRVGPMFWQEATHAA